MSLWIWSRVVMLGLLIVTTVFYAGCSNPTAKHVRHLRDWEVAEIIGYMSLARFDSSASRRLAELVGDNQVSVVNTTGAGLLPLEPGRRPVYFLRAYGESDGRDFEYSFFFVFREGDPEAHVVGDVAWGRIAQCLVLRNERDSGISEELFVATK